MDDQNFRGEVTEDQKDIIGNRDYALVDRYHGEERVVVLVCFSILTISFLKLLAVVGFQVSLHKRVLLNYKEDVKKNENLKTRNLSAVLVVV